MTRPQKHFELINLPGLARQFLFEAGDAGHDHSWGRDSNENANDLIRQGRA